VCCAKFCLGHTQQEISPSNFSIHGENWNSVFHRRRRSSDWDTNSGGKKAKASTQQSIFISIKSFGGKTVVPKLQFQGGGDSVYLAYLLPA